MTLKRKVYKFVSLINSEGLITGFLNLKKRIYKSRNYIFFEKRLTNSCRDVNSNEYAFRIATKKDIHWICKSMDYHNDDLGQELINQQFQNNDITIIGWIHDRYESLVFSAWLSKDDYGLKILGDLVDGTDYSVRRIWVPPAQRKKGIASLGMKHVELVAFSSGAKKIWSFVDENNYSSLLLHSKLDYTRVGKLALIRKWGRTIAKIDLEDTGQCKYFKCHNDIVKL